MWFSAAVCRSVQNDGQRGNCLLFCVCVCVFFPLPFFSQFHPCRCRVYVFSRFMISAIAILQPAAVAAAAASRAACLSKVDDKMAIKRRSLPSARSVPANSPAGRRRTVAFFSRWKKKQGEKECIAWQTGSQFVDIRTLGLPCTPDTPPGPRALLR